MSDDLNRLKFTWSNKNKNKKQQKEVDNDIERFSGEIHVKDTWQTWYKLDLLYNSKYCSPCLLTMHVLYNCVEN